MEFGFPESNASTYERAHGLRGEGIWVLFFTDSRGFPGTLGREGIYWRMFGVGAPDQFLDSEKLWLVYLKFSRGIERPRMEGGRPFKLSETTERTIVRNFTSGKYDTAVQVAHNLQTDQVIA